MTKQELEKAIENGESMYLAFNNKVLELCPNMTFKINNSNIPDTAIGTFSIVYGGISIRENQRIQEFLFSYGSILKTKAEAEHYLHHANVTRTETLPFLTWEEFDKGDNRIKFKSKNGDYCSLEGYFDKDTNYGFIDVVRNWHCVFSKDYTEANFYKAYDECVRLFKGEV